MTSALLFDKYEKYVHRYRKKKKSNNNAHISASNEFLISAAIESDFHTKYYIFNFKH